MPCKGVDEKLHHTVEMLGRQHYREYEVIFTFEAESDPAYQSVQKWTANWTIPRRLVVAGIATQRSQKIHNLLAAIDEVSPDREVLVFVDSDAEPAENWPGYIVAVAERPHCRFNRISLVPCERWHCGRGALCLERSHNGDAP
ncbi:MAG: glycosyltransferase family 2 protein [Planctomycetes bacterium]|nr:glycosyltransferase family 2 protein [Planctomycetota bacterium]